MSSERYKKDINLFEEFFFKGHAAWLFSYYQRNGFDTDDLWDNVFRDTPQEIHEDGFAHCLAMYVLAHRIQDLSNLRGAANDNFFWRSWSDAWPDRWHELYGCPYERPLPRILKARPGMARIYIWHDELYFRTLLRR